jgi:hypothetical protein
VSLKDGTVTDHRESQVIDRFCQVTDPMTAVSVQWRGTGRSKVKIQQELPDKGIIHCTTPRPDETTHRRDSLMPGTLFWRRPSNPL